MFDIGWTELAIVALIALLVIGPKELPATMRMIAGWIGKIRGLAREFQSGLDDMMRETELDKLKEQAQGVMHGDLDGMVENTIDPDGKIRDEFDYGSGYEPFSDFDDPEPEPKPKPAAKKRKTPAKPKTGAAAAKSTKTKSTKTKTTKALTSKAKASGAAATKSRAKSAAKSAATTSASNGAAKTPAKPRAKTAAKKTTAPKPDTSGAAGSDS